MTLLATLAFLLLCLTGALTAGAVLRRRERLDTAWWADLRDALGGGDASDDGVVVAMRGRGARVYDQDRDAS